MIFAKKGLSRSRAGDIFILLFLLFAAAFMVVPLIFVIGNAFKPLDEIFVFPPRMIPRAPTWKNFRDMFMLINNSLVPFSRYIMNTVIITAAGTFGNLACVIMCAYSLAKRDLLIGKVFFRIIVLALMFSAAVTTIPNYLILSRLGWIDTPFSVIIPAFASPLGLYLMKQFMDQIPDALLESAKIDGAGDPSILWHIVVPAVKPAWLTLIIFSVQGLWNLDTSMFIYSEEQKSLSYALGQITTSGIARAGVGGAITLFMLIVPITIFMITQKSILETMTTSGMKD